MIKFFFIRLLLGYLMANRLDECIEENKFRHELIRV